MPCISPSSAKKKRCNKNKQKLETDHRAIMLLDMKLIWEAEGKPTEFLTVPDALFQININAEFTVPRQVFWNIIF